MKILRIILSILIASILATAFSEHFPQAATVNTLDPYGTTTEDLGTRRGVSLALGSSGEPYAVYCIPATTNPVAPAGLGFAYRRDVDHNLDTENWIHQTISTFETGENCTQTVLAFKKVGGIRYLHLATAVDSATESRVIYGYLNLDGVAWNLEEVESGAAGRFRSLSMSIRSDNEPRLSYFDSLSANRDLRYAARTGGAWMIQSLVTEGIAGASSSIAVDSGNNVHIIFSQSITTPTPSYPNFVHAWQTGETWNSETVENDSNGYNAGGNYSLQALPDGSLGVAYVHAVYSGITLITTSIRYASRINGAWSEETLTSYNGSGVTITQMILALNGEIPGIVYGIHPGGTSAETAVFLWSKPTVWSFVGLGQNRIPTSMAYDKTGQVHLSRYTNNQGAVTIYYGFRRLLYPIQGRVTNRAGQAVEGVTIQDTGSTTQVISNAAGEFTINLEAGRQTLVASKDGVGFLQTRQTIPNTRTQVAEIHFITSDYGSNPEEFLYPPVESYNGATPGEFLQDTAMPGNKGRITSWFDHNLPSGGIVDTTAPVNEFYSVRLPGISYKYRFHNGLDIRHDPTMYGQTEKIIAAADGVFVKKGWEFPGFGNYVILKHLVGSNPTLVYYTMYGHLESVNERYVNDSPTEIQVDRDNPDHYIGIMGNTGGNSTGVHLHFGVYRDNGDGLFTGYLSTEKPVDPFGWLRGDEDPNVTAGGAPSVNLWLHLAETSADALPGDLLSYTTGDFQVNILPGFITGPTSITTTRIIGPTPDGLRSLGLTYLLNLLTGYQNPAEDTGFKSVQTGQKTASGLMSISLTYDPASLAHLDQTGLAVMRWDDTASNWITLPSTIDVDLHTVTASVDDFGIFDLQAPLICPGDQLEINDTPAMAVPISTAEVISNQRFDITDDEDWYQIQGQAGQLIQLEIFDIATGVLPSVELLDVGQQVLASGSIDLMSVIPAAGTYFLRVTNTEGELIGCEAVYSIQFFQPHQVYLPLVTR